MLFARMVLKPEESGIKLNSATYLASTLGTSGSVGLFSPLFHRLHELSMIPVCTRHRMRRFESTLSFYIGQQGSDATVTAGNTPYLTGSVLHVLQRHRISVHMLPVLKGSA